MKDAIKSETRIKLDLVVNILLCAAASVCIYFGYWIAGLLIALLVYKRTPISKI